jgi:molybdopterin synthase catalytic subunit/molybdopterin synthase sulfur carrier subunit
MRGKTASPTSIEKGATVAAMSGMVKVLAFAGARDVLGADEIAWPLDDATTAASLLEALVARYAALAPMRRSLRLAVNGRYAGDEDVVRDGDEVAVLPPVAGG